ncbi:acyltransferase [Natrinema marinum]|uniref:acyltransferase n=1 Tax=Natrinema marinum TaxID=2961598 RepID=UPI0020C85B32|nr:acyltransferase [Natrinema marinum]
MLGDLSRVLVPMAKLLFNYMNKIERWYYTMRVKLTAESTGKDLRVNGKSYVNANTELGDNVNFNGMKIRGDGKVTIGDNFHSGPDCRILTRNHNYDNGTKIPYDSTYIRKEVSVGDNVWMGVDSMILPGVNIEEGAIIQAGSTVVSDVPKGAIVGGHPAELFSYRDMEHYKKMKEEGNFQ